MKYNLKMTHKEKNYTWFTSRVIGLITVALTLFITSCGAGSESDVEESTGVDSIAAFIVTKANLDKELFFPGELIPLERAEIFAKVSGYVKKVHVDIGDVVKKGQLLVELEAPELISNYAQANSDAQTAKSKFLSSLDSYNRILSASQTEGSIAKGEIERAKNQMLSDSSNYEAAKSKLTAQGQLKDYLLIRAPFNGMITSRNIDQGVLVGTGTTKAMLIVENNSMLRLRLSIPEAYTSAVPVDSMIQFTVDAYPGIWFNANLSRKSGSLNLTNRTETWEFSCDNSDGKLKAGMFANASIRFNRTAPTFVVPTTAVVTNLEKRFVIKLSNGVTEWIDVRNGMTLATGVEIFGNLNEGDTLLVRGTDEIKPGRVFIPDFQVE